MGKYRRKPTEVEAWQYIGLAIPDEGEDSKLNAAGLQNIGAPIEPAGNWGEDQTLLIETMHGKVEVVVGDFVVKGPRDWWPVDAAQFLETHVNTKEKSIIRLAMEESGWSLNMIGAAMDAAGAAHEPNDPPAVPRT